MIGYLKQLLVIIAAGSGGFFMGSRYLLGFIARDALIAPSWYPVAQNVATVTLYSCFGSMVLWLVVDLHDTGRIDLSKIGESQ